MLLTVLRSYKPKATPGTLFIDGARFCYTLELPEHGGSIPEGIYDVHLTYSNRFKCLMPEILAVPGRTAIRIHWGNFVKDTLGCILVGYESGKDSDGVECIYKSKDCYKTLMGALTKANADGKISLEVKSWDK